MLIVDFSLAVGAVAAAGICLAAFMWQIRPPEKEENNRSLDPRFIRVCAVCTHNYINTREEVISACPRCGSLNKNKKC